LAAIDAQVAQLFRRYDWQRRAAQYLRALLASPATRRNAEQLAGAIEGATPRAFQRFLSEAPWDHRPIIDEVQARLGPLLQSDQGLWVLEEIAFAKQGEHSVGVDRQASGVHGAFQNCQVGVFLAYASPLAQAFVDMQLYLPQSWAEDPVRRRQVGVPDSVMYQSKGDLALTLLRSARAREQLSSQWVTSTGEFGQDAAFRDTLDAEGWCYLLEVPGSLKVYTEPVVLLKLPALLSGSRKPGARGRYVPYTPHPSRIHNLTTFVPPQRWTTVTVESANGSTATIQCMAMRVWDVRDGKPGREHWLLLRRTHQWGPATYYLSNAPAAMPLETLARMSIAGATASAALAEVQKTIGLSEYEVRSWPGWYHHMSLCLLAGAFLMQHDALRERAANWPLASDISSHQYHVP
jgi:SRSO17 transposase